MNAELRAVALLVVVVAVANCGTTGNKSIFKSLENPKWIQAISEIRKEYLGRIYYQIVEDNIISY